MDIFRKAIIPTNRYKQLAVPVTNNIYSRQTYTSLKQNECIAELFIAQMFF